LPHFLDEAAAIRDALDRLITAHAVSLELFMVTNNTADFKNYPGLTIENWVSQPL
jgi:tRNA(fMet)-specific endonuclease VapC